MNKIALNTVPLDGGDVIIKKGSGGGGGVTINNQSKSVDITENGVTEVVANAGFTGLGKVTANVKVPSADIANDDKTRIYVEMSNNLEQEFGIILNGGCVASVDWGDGNIEQLSGDSMAHTYSKAGSYVIAVDVTAGTMGINTCGNKKSVFRLEIGEGISLIGNGCFANCANLNTLLFNGRNTELTLDLAAFQQTGIEEIYIPENIVYAENSSSQFGMSQLLRIAVVNNAILPTALFSACTSLSSVTFTKEIEIFNAVALQKTAIKSLEIPAKQFVGGGFINNTNIEELSLPIVETIPSGAFSGVNSLKKVYIGPTLMTFPSGAFTAAAEFDLTDFTSVPTCQSGAFTAAEGLRIVVPEALYDEWKAEEGWSDCADYIFRETNQEISSGGGSGWTGHADAEGLRAIGWTDEDIAYYQANGVNWNEEDDHLHLVSDDNKALYGVLTADNIYFFNNKDRIVYLPKIDTSGKTSMSQMFKECRSLVSIPQLDTANVTDMSNMFNGCRSLVSIPQLDTANVTNMGQMFYSCSSLVALPQLDTANVTNMGGMFNGCYSLVSIPQLDTANVTNMSSMVSYCYSLVSIPQLDTSKVESMSSMFRECNSLTHANLKNAKLAYQLNNSSLLSKESLLYLINNEAATSAITIKLAPYAYERLANDADIVAALANHPNISISQ